MPVTADVKPTNWATLLGILALMGTCSLHPCTSPRYGYAYRLSIAPNQAVFSKLITLSLTSTLCFREVKYASNPFVYVYYSVTGHVIGYADSPEFFGFSRSILPSHNPTMWNMGLVKLELTVWYRFNSIPVTCIPCYASNHQTACHIDCNLYHVMIETAVTTRTPLLPASSARDVSSTLRSTPCKQLQYGLLHSTESRMFEAYKYKHC